MATIEKQDPVALSMSWGVTFSDYKVDGEKVDFQDMMIRISSHRATTVEGEVAPLTQRIRKRNDDLEELGAALADLTRLQAAFKSDDSGGTQRETMTDATYETIHKFTGNWATKKESKQWVEYYIQRIKSTIDGLNNQAQTDMSRLQSLVDRRDESFSTASNLMTAISDTRSNLIRNL